MVSDKEIAAALNITAAEYEGLPNGTKVSYNYRGSKHYGTIVGIHKQGDKSSNTSYSVRPHKHYQGEDATIHRMANKVRKVREIPASAAVLAATKTFTFKIRTEDGGRSGYSTHEVDAVNVQSAWKALIKEIPTLLQYVKNIELL